MERRQPEHQVAGLQGAEPFPGGGLRDGAVVRQGRVVQQLAGAAGAQFHEALERGQVADVGNGAHVALHVGGRVCAEPVRGVEAAVEYARVAAGEQRFLQGPGVLREAHRLAPRQGQQVVHRGPAREGLADGREQGKVLRTRQDPATGRRVVVDDALQVGGQVRRAVYLVDDGAVGEFGKEGVWVLLGEPAHVQGFEGEVAMAREQGAAEGGLAALPRSGEGDGREALRGLPDSWSQVAFDGHAGNPTLSFG